MKGPKQKEKQDYVRVDKADTKSTVVKKHVTVAPSTMLTERAGDGVCARAAKIASLLDVSPASSTAARSTSSKPHSSGSGLAPLSTGGSGGLSGEPLGEAAARQRSCDGAQLLDTSALAAQHASEAAATAAALQQHLETMAIKASDSSSAACAPAAAAGAQGAQAVRGVVDERARELGAREQQLLQRELHPGPHR